jgi:uncharacterized protein
MLDVIERLLILQDRDRKVVFLHSELATLAPQRHSVQGRAADTQEALETAKLRLRHLEADRKKLELDAEAHKQQIEKYSLQQFQTKKNEEYRALAHEIQMAREAIVKLEDQQLELMEQAEATQKELLATTRVADEAKILAEKQLIDLTSREENLRQELAKLESDRDQLAALVEPGLLQRYERLRRNKGDRVIVGVAHGVCGGCHMRLPAQILVSCQGDQEIVTCPNCARLLYYTRDMSLAAAE